MIDRIFRKVKGFLNTEGRGNFEPAKFDEFLHDAIQSRNEEYVYEINRATNRENRGLGHHFIANIPNKLHEKVMHYVTTTGLALSSNTTRTIPSTVRYIDDIFLADGTSLEFCKSRSEYNILKTTATSQYPIYTKSDNLIWVHPESTDLMQISFLRQILIPKWTYQKVNNQELFDSSASDFQDADIHPSEENEMVRRVLMSFGVNLKEQDITQFTMQEENSEFTKENTP